MKRPGLVLAIALAACLALAGVSLNTAIAASNRRAEALARAAAAGADTDALTLVEGWDGRAVYSDSRTGDELIVDDNLGSVVAFADGEAFARLQKVDDPATLMSRGELLAKARSYVAGRFEEWGSLASATIEVAPRWTDAKGRPHAYEAVVRVRRLYKGLATTDFIELTLNPATGEVANVAQVYGPIDVDVSPRLTKAAAEAAAVKAVDAADGVPRSSGLSIWRDPRTGRAHLVSWVEVQGAPVMRGEAMGSGRAFVAVDMHSGEILASMR